MTTYFSELLDTPDSVIGTLAHHLKNPIFGRVDFVAGIGLSGTMPLVPLRQLSGCRIVALRKLETSSHGSGTACSGSPPSRGERYLIVDDFTITGKTMSTIRKRLRKCECVGALLYCGESSEYKRGIPVIPLNCEVRRVERLLKKGYEIC